MDTVDLRAQAVARSQYGRATRRQLVIVAGVSRATVARRLKQQVWVEPLPGVIDLGTHEPSWRGRALEVVLAAGEQSWASHLTAGHLHRFLDLDRPTDFDVLVLRDKRRDIGRHRVHTTHALGADEITECHGIRCTTKARTLLDLAASTAPGQLERWIADAARRDGKLLDGLVALTDRHRRAPGRRRLLEVLGRLPDGTGCIGSPLEVQGVQELIHLGAPTFQLQYVVRDAAGARIKRVDVAWPERWRIIEFDGAAYHDLSEAREEDERVRSRMRALGWTVDVVRRADLGGHTLPRIVRQLRRETP